MPASGLFTIFISLVYAIISYRLTGKTPLYLYNKIKYRTDIHNINIMFKNTLTTPQHRLELFELSFSYCSPTICNKLSIDLKHLENNYSFIFPVLIDE